jgi:5'-3' exonuclease/transcription antitermination factor NusG
MSEWVVLELSPKSEGEDPDAVRDGILRTLRQPAAEVFIPAAVTQIGDDRVIHYLLEGYAFVRRDLPDDTSYLRLEGSRFVQAVLTKPNGSKRSRMLATVKDDHIARFRSQIQLEVNQGIGVGDTVTITSGHYKHIEATVIEDIPEQDTVQVFIKLRSKQTIVTLPRSFLRIASRSPLSPLFARLALVRTWAHGVRPVFQWQGLGFEQLRKEHNELVRIQTWHQRGKPARSFLQFWDFPLERRNFSSRIQELSVVESWLRRVAPISRFFRVRRRVEQEETLSLLEAQVLELAWFEDVLDRGRRLKTDINELLRKISTRRRTGVGNVQNLIVDGHNLAFRCLYAPGISDLKDSQNRPTGVILGFLRSLGALKKRFPTAVLFVSWDGSSQNRKDKYPDYKANRPAHVGPPAFDQMGYLRKILPALGVFQVFNPKEEADDVIASLVRRKLGTQKTLIFGTDRDFLQLVNEHVSVLIPAVGSRKELLFEPDVVKERYGVNPGDMVQLRALLGDSSDNLPGVPRVPKKVLKALIQAHGSVEGLYRSGLAGLTKIQYERVRSAEPQVRINLDLMALLDVPFTKIDPNPDPNEAASLLREVEINPNSILETFFDKSSEVATGLTL